MYKRKEGRFLLDGTSTRGLLFICGDYWQFFRYFLHIKFFLQIFSGKKLFLMLDKG